MPFIVIVVGAVIMIAAFNETHADLAHALEADIPGYFKWAIAIAAILGLGFIPAMKVPSRYLIALVAIVVVFNNYQNIFGGFAQFAQAAPTGTGTGGTDPTAAYVQSGGAAGTPTSSQIAGNEAAQAAANAPPVLSAAQKLAADPLNPNSYIGLAAGFGGLA